jgi:hypothetical protein
LYGLGAAAGATKRGVGNVIEHITQPQSIADANIAKLYGNTPDVVAKLQGADQLVPGEMPSAAQVLQTPEAV